MGKVGASRSTRVAAGVGMSHAGEARPTEAQRRYLARGLTQAGGKLPLFDRDGREVPRKTVESCLSHGWAEPWTRNPIKPDWQVCRLTEAGRRALQHDPEKCAAVFGKDRPQTKG
jgi:hypothetical protein